MATNQVDSRSALAEKSTDGFSIPEIAQAIVTPLASLRLTVALLFLAVLMTWVATLQQAENDVFFVKMRHFSSVLVEVPVQTFFPPAWAPQMQNVPGTLYLPSGLSILVLMIINLTAAHSLRFKIQAAGARLVTGIIALLVAIAVTGLVIANGQRPGVQTEPWIDYTDMWLFMQLSLLGLGVGTIVWSFFLGPKRRLERWTLLYLGGFATLAAVVLLVASDSVYIGDSAMRILWQLAQATVAAIAGYVACLFLFKRKAGMVLLHIGIMGLMLNEIWVTTIHKEHRLTVAEGETSSEVSDIRYYEMAIIDASDPEVDRVITVPAEKLARLEPISSDELPFDIRCVEYLRNSVIDSGGAPVGNPATAGLGVGAPFREITPVSGTGTDKGIDMPTAYVELFDKTNSDSLGIYAISMNRNDDLADRVTVGGKDYHILLRVETLHKPYKITLKDAIREDYPGSDKPKYFGSEVMIDDTSTGEVTPQKIFMNNPLRYGGETFYQSMMFESKPGGPQVSVFQVVTNVGWMIPYVCCMFTVVGLLGQFVQSLLAYLNKQIQVSKPKPIPVAEFADPMANNSNTIKDPLQFESPHSETNVKPKGRFALQWLPALIVVGLLGIWALMAFGKSNKEVVRNEMRLDLLGQVPVTYEGRVQPLDSFARNTLRQLSHRETVADGNDVLQPAIAWLADGMFGADAFNDYRTFYMTDPNVKNALDLPAPQTVKVVRKKYVYTINEVMSRKKELLELIPDREKNPEKNWTPLQRRLELLRRSTSQVENAQYIISPPDNEKLIEDVKYLLELRSSNFVPYIVATNDPQKPWSSMAAGMGPAWISAVAGDLKSLDAVAEKIAQDSWSDEDLAEPGLRRIAVSPQFRELMGAEGAAILESLGTPEGLKAAAASMPKELRRIAINAEMEFRTAKLAPRLVPLLQEINNGNSEIASPEEIPNNVALLMKLKPAYRTGDAKTFNQTLETYLASINQAPPAFYSATTNRLERIYNASSPFYLAIVSYILSLVFVFISWTGVGWRGWRISTGRIAAGLLLLGLSIHIVGIVMRVAISGRPPVTNLYSSVIFVTAAGIVIALLMELFTRMSVGTMLGAVSGVGGLLWANSMTVVDGDTFTVMLAVLDTTFWLATHVIMISLGYAATFMAGLLGVVYLFSWVFTSASKDKQFCRLFSNMLYGVVCFGLLASFFGTVLGGLWGDDSWGRFWGWDPKENGALMIVLWNALILHARWGGLVKERGVASLAILGNLIVLWSWKGVNLLGVGLHAYAASEDKTIKWVLLIALIHLIVACFALLPPKIRLFGRESGVKS